MATTTKTEDQRVMKLPKVPLIRKVWLHTTAAHREAFGKASTKRGKGWAKLLTTVPVAWLGLLVWVALVLVWSCVLGWVNDLHRFFKDEDDTDLRRKLAVFRWLSLVNTALLIALLAFAFPAAFPLGVMVLGAAVTNRVTAQVWKSRKNPFAPKTGFVKKAGDRYAASVIVRDGEAVGSWWWRAACASLLVPIVAFAIEGLKAPELATYGLIVPDVARDIAVAAVVVFALLLAVLGGVSTGRRLRAEFGHEVAFKDALREKLILVLSQESPSGQKQFMTAEEAGLLRMERKGAEWEITLPVQLMPALRDKGALRRAIRRELDTDQLNFELVDEEWEGHFTLGPVGPIERRIRDNLRASGGTPENGGLEKGLTEDDLGFDDPSGTEETLPRELLNDLTSWEATARAAAPFAELGLQLVGFNARTRKGILEPEATATPRARWKSLNLPVGASERAVRDAAERLARMDSAVILDVDVTDRRVFLSPMLPAVAALRASLVTELKTDPTQVKVAVTWSPEDRVEAIDVWTRAVSPDPEVARELWRKVINAIPGGSNGWQILPNAVDAVTRLQWGPKRSLPALVDGEALLPDRAAEAWETDWARLPLGIDSTGGIAAVDLKAGPHAAIIGSTGSGKTVAVRELIVQAILRGFEVIGIDPTKQFGGLTDLAPYTMGLFTESVEQAAAVMTEVYEEVRRRVALNTQYGVEDWEGLPAGTVRPRLVVIDEWASLVEEDPRPSGSTKGTEDYAEWESETAAKGRIKGRARKLAREARSAGVHLILLSQIANVEAIPSAIRENLGTSVQLRGKRPITASSIDMLFKGQGEEALREFEELKGGKGLAVSLDEGDSVRGFRVGLLEPSRLIPALEERGARKPAPLVLPAPENDESAAPAKRSPRQSPAPARQAAPAPRPAPSPSQDDDWLL